MIRVVYRNNLHGSGASLKIIRDTFELTMRFLLRPKTGKAGYLLVFAGLWFISPPLAIELINLVLAELGFGDVQLSAPEPMPVIGSLSVLLGVLLLLVSHLWAPRHSHKEVIGIRHNSLGAFPKEDVRKDLPLLQRLETYREIDVDHSDSYTKGILEDHGSVIRRLERIPQELSGLLRSAPNSPIVAYYGLPHIPLAFYLGYLLSDNKYRIQLYDLNNQSRRWDQLSGVSGFLEIDNTLVQVPSSDEIGDVTIAVGISYPVHASEIAELGLSNILGTIEINARRPQRQLISNQDQIDQICTEFRRALEAVKNKFPHRQRIHLFYAGPVSLCFALGRCVSERIDPEIIIYNYSSKAEPKYSWSLSLNSPHLPSATFNSALPTGGDRAPVQYA